MISMLLLCYWQSLSPPLTNFFQISQCSSEKTTNLCPYTHTHTHTHTHLSYACSSCLKIDFVSSILDVCNILNTHIEVTEIQTWNALSHVCRDKMANSDVTEGPFSFRKMMKFSLGEQNMTIQEQIFNIPVSSNQLLNPVTHTKFQDLPYPHNSNFMTCVTHKRRSVSCKQ
jgi:hypothetical protein